MVNLFTTPNDERALYAPNRSQPGPTSVCPGWPFSVWGFFAVFFLQMLAFQLIPLIVWLSSIWDPNPRSRSNSTIS